MAIEDDLLNILLDWNWEDVVINNCGGANELANKVVEGLKWSRDPLISDDAGKDQGTGSFTTGNSFSLSENQDWITEQ